MRMLAIGSQALMDGFALLGIETYTDMRTEQIEILLNNIIRSQERALIFLQQDIAQSNIPVLQQLHREGGNILISEVPLLQEPANRKAPIDDLITKVIGPSALENNP